MWSLGSHKLYEGTRIIGQQNSVLPNKMIGYYCCHKDYEMPSLILKQFLYCLEHSYTYSKEKYA